MLNTKTMAVETDGVNIARPWDEGAPVTDWSAFPGCYALLLNQRLSRPMDMSLWRMKLDTTRQLFVDDELVAHMANLHRTCHTTTDHPASPVLPGCWAEYIYPDPEHGLRMYYMSKGSLAHVAYSQDGLAWAKPDLGLVDVAALGERFAGGPNNVVADAQLHGMFYEPNDPDPSRRWKLISTNKKFQQRWLPPGSDQPAKPVTTYKLMVSPDGYRWRDEAETNLMRSLTIDFRAPYQRPMGTGDVLQVQWDPKLRTYLAHIKQTIGPDLRLTPVYHAGRAIAMSESDDLIHWSTPRYYAYPDGEDAKMPGMYGIYEANGFPYESMWFNYLSMTSYEPADPELRKDRKLERNRPYIKRNWIRLAASRDGRHYYYFGDRVPFVPHSETTERPAHYNRMANLINVGGPVVHDDELWFYHIANTIDGPKLSWQYNTRLATLRRDGFASLDAGNEPGVVITRPTIFTGKGELFINAQTKSNGFVRASVIEENGSEIAGFTESDAVDFQGNSTRVRLAWKNHQTLASLKDRYVRLAFNLRNASLFSFWIA